MIETGSYLKRFRYDYTMYIYVVTESPSSFASSHLWSMRCMYSTVLADGIEQLVTLVGFAQSLPHNSTVEGPDTPAELTQ